MRSPHAKRRLYPVAQDDDLTGQFIKKRSRGSPSWLVASGANNIAGFSLLNVRSVKLFIHLSHPFRLVSSLKPGSPALFKNQAQC
jgi:hypothetical protein